MTKKSIESFIQQVNSGALDTNRHLVYREVRMREKANLDTLRRALPRMPHQSLTSALSTLNDAGLIFQNNSGYYEPTAPNKYEYVSKMRERVRYEKWKKQGEENGWFKRQFEEDLDVPEGVVAIGLHDKWVGFDESGQLYLIR